MWFYFPSISCYAKQVLARSIDDIHNRLKMTDFIFFFTDDKTMSFTIPQNNHMYHKYLSREDSRCKNVAEQSKEQSETHNRNIYAIWENSVVRKTAK